MDSKRVGEFLDQLMLKSSKYRHDTIYSCPTRIAHHKITGHLDGKFYSIEVIVRRFETPELIIRDWTVCKTAIITLWDEL